MTYERRAMATTARFFAKTASALCGALLVAAAAPVSSAVPLADTPLFLAVSVPPNITVTLDDSGSMSRAWVPENCTNENSDINGCTQQAGRFDKSSTRNLIFYNPNVAYPLPKKADGTTLTTTFTAAYRNGFDTAEGTVDLSMSYRPTASLHLRTGTATEVYMPHSALDFKCNTTAKQCQARNPTTGIFSTPPLATACTTTTGNTPCTGVFSTTNNNNSTLPAQMPAYYYLYDKTVSGCATVTTTTIITDSCYKLVFVSAPSGPAGTDERQNFANWFSFARTRNLATLTAASLAFADLSPTVRVAWQSLNSCRGSASALATSSCQGWKANFNLSNAIKPFTGTQKANFYSWLTQLPTNGGTGLPEAMRRAGDYYSTTGENSPYDNDYSTSNSGEYSCRRNYHIMMTDGIWNNAITTGNRDGSTTTLPEKADVSPEPTITQYAPIPPYADKVSDTLADVAFKYWITDLRPTLFDNLLPLYTDRTDATLTASYWNAKNDPATWQHMVNYTIGLGLAGYLSTTTPVLTYNGTYGGSYPNLALPTSNPSHLDWPQASASGTAANVADLWHAAINSRGQFFNANDPAALSAAFQSVLTAISSDSGSSASLSANSTSVQPGKTLVYQANFNQDWSGGLKAYPVGDTGVGAVIWDASKLIPAPASRKMFTYNGTVGVVFNACANLNAAQKLVLNTNPSSGVVDNLCPDRLNWLRGDTSKELRRTGGIFRNRPTTVMGDIINSDPGYVEDIDYEYAGLPATTPGQSSYASFVAGNASRMPMVYVGANDGHLYGIRADQGVAQSGVEQFSYIPAGVFANLNRLTDPAYSHRYYVDGAITVGDAYLGGTWKSVLVAGLNGGGKSIYALDVTDPANFSESKVMWEFKEQRTNPANPPSVTDPPVTLGLTFSQPQIGILQNGLWVAVFGNGYNSESGGAYLYVVDLKTGVLIKKILASDVGLASGAFTDESNGLSTPLLVDSNGDKLMDTVYAGDLQGNLWKFDLSGDVATWGVAFSGSPLFTARNASGQVQPITSQPKIGGLAIGGKIVTFGTGRYLTATDVSDKAVQTFYGIRDNGVPVTSVNRSELQQQTISTQTPASGLTVRIVSRNEVDWTTKKGWYLDLVDPPAPGTAQGERVVSTPLIRDNRVIFVTITPSGDVCTPGGTSWLMESDLSTGGGFDHSILDINRDGKVDSTDSVGGKFVSGEKLDQLGISKTPVLLDHAPGFDKLFTGTTGKIEIVKNDSPPPAPGGIQRRSWIQIR